MSLINRTGTFRGDVTDHAINTTRNGFPQLVAVCKGLEYYDEENNVWVDWSEYAESELTAYLVLFDGQDNKTLNCQQVEKVFGWNDGDFETLNNMDASRVKIQFRVAENTFEDKTTLQIEWIDEYDATPGRVVKRLDADELKQLQAKYAGKLKPKTKATSAPKAKPTAPKTKPPGKKTESPATTTTAPPERTDIPAGKCTKQEAWDTVLDLKKKTIKDDKLSTIWRAKVDEIAGKVPDANVTDEQWFLIKEAVLKETAVF